MAEMTVEAEMARVMVGNIEVTSDHVGHGVVTIDGVEQKRVIAVDISVRVGEPPRVRIERYAVTPDGMAFACPPLDGNGD